MDIPLSRRNASLGMLAGSLAALAPKLAPAQTSELVQIAIDSYVHGKSLITTDVTRLQMINVARPDELRAPIRLGHRISRRDVLRQRGGRSRRASCHCPVPARRLRAGDSGATAAVA